MSSLKLNKKYLEELKSIFATYIPQEEIWVYGSRVVGDAHEGSDLDIVIRHPDNLDQRQEVLFDIKEAITESNIPILVDVLDWALIPESFRNEIRKNYHPL
jgi:uncharacterized protein